MGFPYEDTSVYLDIRECDTVYFFFNNTPNIANTVTHEGYDSLELDYKIDGKEYNIVAYQDWGESNIYLHESSESRFMETLENLKVGPHRILTPLSQQGFSKGQDWGGGGFPVFPY